ncbi:CocE/NonD family hydrolase [Streptomyces phaeochromogenes]|uniref:CocE/NonD family hydrolase n=1 Tax=Streptomyces phaeochromogenes TaxID=1923 RepID=UPI00386FA1C4
MIVARTPYDKTDPSELLYIDPWAAVRRGFLTVVQDVRGRYTSEGDDDWRPIETEAADGADTIAWAVTAVRDKPLALRRSRRRGFRSDLDCGPVPDRQ